MSISRSITRSTNRSIRSHAGSRFPSNYIARWDSNGVDSIGESTILVDRSGNGNNATVFGYCLTFDGSAGQYISGSQILGNETIADFGGTASTLTIASGKVTPSAGTVEWFQFVDGRKYILQSSKTALQSKFWNVNGSVVDFVTVVGLTAPYCATKSSSALLLSGYNHQENLIGTNIGQNSEPSSLTRIGTNGGITAGVPAGALTGFDGELIYGDNSTLRYCQYTGTNADNTIYMSAYIAMDDGSEPKPGAHSDATKDFVFYMRGGVVATGYTVTLISSGIYKVSLSKIGTGASAVFGIYKYTTQSAKPFRVTRFHVHINPSSEYIKAYYTDSIAMYNPGGIPESFVPSIKISSSAVKIVCIGDSLTAGDYPVHLKAIFPRATIVDKGDAGDSVADMKGRFVADVIDQSPDYICYFGCVNSIIGDVSAAAINADIDWMVSTAGSIPMVIGTGTPFGTHANWSVGRQAVMDSINAHVLAITAPNVIGKVDLFTPLLAAGSSVNLVSSAELTPGEGLHINTAGNTLVARLFHDALNLDYSVLPAKNILGTDLAPGLIVLNAPAELEVADVDDRWFTSSVANDVEPTTIPANAGNKIFRTSTRLIFYASDIYAEPSEEIFANYTDAENYTETENYED